ncbi:MAG: tandem-95 repeat protein, partial [Planctomycetes bacterium]|nr:tandem-95 repeat protein [Planctomycetota bacterium]
MKAKLSLIALGLLSSCVTDPSVTDLSVPTQDLKVQLNEDQVFTQEHPGILSGYHLKSHATYSVRVLSDVFNGSLHLSNDGALEYSPIENFFGIDSFLFQLLEDGEVVHTGTVQLHVANVPDDPVIAGETFELREDQKFEVSAPGILKNDSDPDGDTLKIEILKQPDHGTLVMNDDGSFSYTGKSNYFGSDSFNYCVSDSAATSVLATTELKIHAVNDRPQLTTGTITIKESEKFIITAEHL